MSRRKTEVEKKALNVAFDDATADLEGLRDEMQEWQDNLESSGLEHLPKYDEVCECVEPLDSAVSELEGVDLDGLPTEVTAREIEFQWVHPYGRYGRGWRLGSVIAALNAVAGALHPEDGDEDNEVRQACEDAAGTIGDVVSELEGIEFPGMY